MSQISKASSGGGGGGTTQFTTDNGIATQAGGNIDVLGQDAITVPVMFTAGSGDTVTVENRTWITQYVVDPTATVGLRGTFQTIQAAMDQAEADGMTFSNQKVIYIRSGSYTENLIFKSGSILVGQTLSNFGLGGSATANTTTITGTHTFENGVVISNVIGINNISFVTTSGNMFDGSSSNVPNSLFFNNCYFSISGGGQFITGMRNNSGVTIFSSVFVVSASAIAITTTRMIRFVMKNCDFVGSPIIDGTFNTIATTITIKDCYGLGGIITDGVTNIYNSTFTSTISSNYAIANGGTTSASGTIQNCIFQGYVLGVLQNSNNNWIVSNVTLANSSAGASLFTSGAIASVSATLSGNIYTVTKSATNIQITPKMFYIGITNTSAARTIGMPDTISGLPSRGQRFIIKDENGLAGSNNITIQTVDGTTLIDGAASILINTNYGAVTILFDGTNYFTISRT